jgi:hypothetical protein
MANDGRTSPPGIPIRNHRRLERESSLTSQHSQYCRHTSSLPAPQQGHDPTAAATATMTSEGTGNTSRSRTSRTLGGGVDLETWLDSTATAVQQMHEGDAGVDGAEQQHDPMFESPDRVDHETDFEGRYSATCAASCCEGHTRTTTEDSGDNNGDSTPGSSTARPSRSISSAKTEDGPGEGEEEEEDEEEPQRAYRAGDGQPSGSSGVCIGHDCVQTWRRNNTSCIPRSCRPTALDQFKFGQLGLSQFGRESGWPWRRCPWRSCSGVCRPLRDARSILQGAL